MTIDNTPLLTVITRACQRPNMLRMNIQSVRSQTSKDVEQIFIIDNQRRGIKWANSQFDANKERVIGKYVFMLDDDCRFIDNTFVVKLTKIVSGDLPDLVMVKTRRPQLAPTELPRKEHWGKPHLLKIGSTNGMCYVTRADLWKSETQRYFVNAAGDWTFLSGLLPRAKKIVWMNLFASETMQLGRGKMFEQCSQGWFGKIVKDFGIENIGTKQDQDWRIRYWMQ